MSEEEEESRGSTERVGEFGEETTQSAPDEPLAAEKLEDEEKSGVSVQMILSTETIIEVKFLQEYLRLPTRADVVAAAISISSLLLREVKQGGSVYVESRIGSKSKLSLGRKDNAG